MHRGRSLLHPLTLEGTGFPLYGKRPSGPKMNTHNLLSWIVVPCSRFTACSHVVSPSVPFAVRLLRGPPEVKFTHKSDIAIRAKASRDVSPLRGRGAGGEAHERSEHRRLEPLPHQSPCQPLPPFRQQMTNLRIRQHNLNFPVSIRRNLIGRIIKQ